ncbi:MAG: hypothetical protein DYG94_13575 [Leptolyngbya sp. PLA3]|nr:MAG: hypothetical protein EDM82_14130 [Cyanobacteria bacterium CYA]MCE7969756.1 hypothetical protein [Leptolyngbya sp. PL-A3]
MAGVRGVLLGLPIVAIALVWAAAALAKVLTTADAQMTCSPKPDPGRFVPSAGSLAGASGSFGSERGFLAGASGWFGSGDQRPAC